MAKRQSKTKSAAAVRSSDLLAAGQWYPMNLAPKDGRLIIVSLGESKAYIYLVSWMHSERDNCKEKHWCEHHWNTTDGNYLTSEPCAWTPIPPVTNQLLNKMQAANSDYQTDVA